MMRVKVSGVNAQVLEPKGKLNYGDIVKVIKMNIIEFDYSKAMVYVSDKGSNYWLELCKVKLFTSK